MAISSTIFKAELNISDMNRNYYQTHALTLARHPSETDERMMVRLLAFALNAHDGLQFTRGLSTEDEPELWLKNDTGEIDLWIELGQPDEKRLRKACGRARQVRLYCYQSRSCDVWWQQNENKLQRLDNLQVIKVCRDVAKQLVDLTQRTMQLQCTVQDALVWFADQSQTIEIELQTLKD